MNDKLTTLHFQANHKFEFLNYRWNYAIILKLLFLATPEHGDIPHVLFDYHAESGPRRLEKLEAKVKSLCRFRVFLELRHA